jgi:hypothetical protein
MFRMRRGEYSSRARVSANEMPFMYLALERFDGQPSLQTNITGGYVLPGRGPLLEDGRIDGRCHDRYMDYEEVNMSTYRLYWPFSLTIYSIIFTCWTRTLDLLEFYLKQACLDSRYFQRIDGECPTTKRERILAEFADNSNLRVLIMTTGTGAVGYVTI